MDQVKKLNATQEAAHHFLSLKRGTPQHMLWAAAQKGGSAIDEYREFQIRVAREFSDLSKYFEQKEKMPLSRGSTVRAIRSWLSIRRRDQQPWSFVRGI